MLGVLVSCTWEQDIEHQKLYFEYNTEQPTVIDIDVIPIEGIELEYNDMLAEVNADYYNRYGIAINLILKAPQQLPDNVVNGNVIFTPENNNENIAVYIIPKEYIKLQVYGYTVISNYFNTSIVIGDDSQTNRVLAHEIGHAYGLEHTHEDQNIMTPKDIAWQYDYPNHFNQEQISTIMQTLNTNKKDLQDGLRNRINGLFLIVE